MFEVGNYDSATNNFTFGKGGFQGARGSNSGGDWFIENVMEELDNPVRQKSDSDRTHTRLALQTQEDHCTHPSAVQMGADAAVH